MTAATPLASRRRLLDLAAVALLLAVPIVGFGPSFDGPAYLVSAVGGALLGMGIAVLGTVCRWGTLILTAFTVVAYFVFGTALALPHAGIAAVIPSLASLRQLALGVVTSWKGLLTTVGPVSASDGHLIVPLLLSLVAAVLTTSAALRARHAAWAVLPAAAFLGAQIAFGMSQPALPVVQGLVFAVVAVVWLAACQAWSGSGDAFAISAHDGAAKRPSGRRVIAGAAVVAVAATAGVATSAFAAPNEPRYVLRDVVIPPFDVREYPSPLQSFRGVVRDDADTPLFSVSGLPADARVRLGTMDAYSGIVYSVSDAGAGDSSAFGAVRSNMSADAEGVEVTLRFEIDGYAGVWMPDAGAVRSIDFDGPRADELRRTAHYNEVTGTAVVTAGLGEGDAYTLRTVLPVERADATLEGVGFAPITLPDQEEVPQELVSLASDALGEASSPIQRVRALQVFLADEGFFSHGLEGEVHSRAGHGSERISALVGGEQMVGDDEQYAVAMALMARELGMPARVVMGFYPDEDAAQGGVFTATGETLHAWVEVAFEGAGWVPFDPTPPEDQVPSDQATKPKADPKPQALQPPPPIQEAVDLPVTVPDDREAEEEDEVAEGFAGGVFLVVGGASLLLLAVLLAPLFVIGALKATRRRKRRQAERAFDRISGGWDELVDRAVDYGTEVRPGATRVEDAVAVESAFAEPRVATLARHADTEVFGPAEPTAADAEEFWRQVDEILAGIGAKTSFWGRLQARASLRSLTAGTRFARTPRGKTPGGDEAPTTPKDPA